MMQPINRNERLPDDSDVESTTGYCWWWAPYDGWLLCDARAIDDYQWWLPYLELPDMDSFHTLHVTLEHYNPWREAILNRLMLKNLYQCPHNQDPELALTTLLAGEQLNSFFIFQ